MEVLGVDHLQGMSDRTDETVPSRFGRVPARVLQKPGNPDGSGDEHPRDRTLDSPHRRRVIAVFRWNRERNGQSRQQLDSQLKMSACEMLDSTSGRPPVDVGDQRRLVRGIHDDARHRGTREHPTQTCDQLVRTQICKDPQWARIVRLYYRRRAGEVMVFGCLRPCQYHHRPDHRVVDRRRVHQVRVVGQAAARLQCRERPQRRQRSRDQAVREFRSPRRQVAQRLQKLGNSDTLHGVEQLVDDTFVKPVRRTTGNRRQPAPSRGSRVRVDVNRGVHLEKIEIVQDANGRRVRGRSQAPSPLHPHGSLNPLEPQPLCPLGSLCLGLLLASANLGLQVGNPPRRFPQVATPAVIGIEPERHMVQPHPSRVPDRDRTLHSSHVQRQPGLFLQHPSTTDLHEPHVPAVIGSQLHDPSVLTTQLEVPGDLCLVQPSTPVRGSPPAPPV
ncbi:hypothetical protein LV75_001767 [Actinokineospora diospyrosa]|uniref:Uncharacterized protein n=1 Tax=Actinokineospora diospyrosa TaxID=103728 RepID=A0ABT1I9G7_9PSEU|nr:hypothetical protein [Actinokineospora diospyrosa]